MRVLSRAINAFRAPRPTDLLLTEGSKPPSGKRLRAGSASFPGENELSERMVGLGAGP